jgi:hypothetical protein
MAERNAAPPVSCSCKSCLKNKPNSTTECALEKRAKAHMRELSKLLVSFSSNAAFLLIIFTF